MSLFFICLFSVNVCWLGRLVLQAKKAAFYTQFVSRLIFPSNFFFKALIVGKVYAVIYFYAFLLIYLRKSCNFFLTALNETLLIFLTNMFISKLFMPKNVIVT